MPRQQPLLTLLPLQVMLPKLLRRSFQTEGWQSERQTNQIQRLRMTFLLQQQNAGFWLDGMYARLGLYCEILENSLKTRDPLTICLWYLMHPKVLPIANDYLLPCLQRRSFHCLQASR